MLDIINWRRTENFHNGNFDCFIREVALHAQKIQTEQRMLLVYHNRDGKETNYPPKRTHHFIAKKRPHTKVVPNAYQQKAGNPNENNEQQGSKRKRDTFEAQFCLNLKCRVQRKRHHLNRCEILEKETKTALLDQYEMAKMEWHEEQKKTSGHIGSLLHTSTSTHSSIFRA